MRRKPLSMRQTIQVLINQGVVIRCPKSGLLLTSGQDATDEHLHQRATGGGDDLDNRQIWHVSAAKRKTFGTKATSAGSDAHARAKVKRLANGGRKRKGRKLKGRPFSKAKRHFNRGGRHGDHVPKAD